MSKINRIGLVVLVESLAILVLMFSATPNRDAGFWMIIIFEGICAIMGAVGVVYDEPKRNDYH